MNAEDVGLEMEVEAPDVITISDDEEDVNIPAKIEEFKTEGNRLFKAGAYKQAVEKYSEAIVLAPATQEVALCYGNRSACYIELGDYDAALADLETTKFLEPTFQRYYGRVVKCKTLKGDFKGANDVISRVGPNDLVDAQYQTSVKLLNDVEKSYKNAKISFEKGDYRSSIYHMNTILNNGIKAYDMTAFIAECYAMHANYAKAHEMANSVLAVDKKNVEAIYVRSMCLYYEEELDKSISEFRRALVFDPEHKKSRDALRKAKDLKNSKDDAKKLFDASNFKEAQLKYRECLTIDPKHDLINAKLHYNIGLTLQKLKQYSEAIQEFGKALKLKSTYANVFLKRAKCYHDMEKYQEAVNDYETLYKMYPTPQNKSFLDRAKWELTKSKRTNYYKILGVTESATSSEIKKAYREKCKTHHPDKHPDASDSVKKEQEKIFKQVSEAYEVIGDETKRRNYDLGRSENESPYSYAHQMFSGSGGMQGDFFPGFHFSFQ